MQTRTSYWLFKTLMFFVFHKLLKIQFLLNMLIQIHKVLLQVQFKFVQSKKQELQVQL